ncbi:DUF6048 family protein [uncultured Lacinutrix sp.]|uniref:DUF6048 family protein n=1 Tax=uncultured Lacinutrix sp. TaxID=574032 RepID=UPI00261AF1CA|nr:DUF6048 family protein [uncultured Lacinutrix sp.]
MKQQHILTYYISSIFSLLLCCTSISAQEDTTVTDSTKTKQKYGIRIGVDASKLLRSFIDDDYQGFELNGDYRLTKNLYLAAEIGNEEKTTTNDFLNVTAKGSYLKAGVDYNLYDNWLGMENMIYSGFRVGTSTFSQTLNNFSVYAQDQFWQPQFSSNEIIETKGLSSVWIELQMGIKAEVLNNLFLGLNFQLKGNISQDQPVNYENLYIPGFNKTFDSGRIGVGYGYTISYLIPIFKKG